MDEKEQLPAGIITMLLTGYVDTIAFQRKLICAALIGTLRPYPQPAYITNSPYQSIAANVAGACGCTYNAG